MSALEVIAPGMLSLVQDLGRSGVAHLGLSHGGPMDLHAHCWANHLLGNSPHAATLEITMGQASFTTNQDIQLALTGADMQPSIDGKPVPMWQTLWLRAGQEIKLSIARHGLRTYLGVLGGIESESVLGSRASVPRNGIGQPLQAGDRLPLGEGSPAPERSVATWYIPSYPRELRIGLFNTGWGLSSAAFEQLCQGTYQVSPNSDRMGLRLTGEAIETDSSGIISEGIAPGAVQLPPDGQPIILMSDRQTLGGYAKLGHVSRLDLARLGQAAPGTQLSFYQADMADAREQLDEFCRFFNLA